MQSESQMQKKAQQEAQRQQRNKDKQSYLKYLLHKPKIDVLVAYQVMKIKTVKPQKAKGIQNSLINAATKGMLKNRLSQAELVNLLERESEAKGQQKITFKRRGIDDEW